MKDKQTKLWLSMFVLALMFIGGTVSYAAKNNVFFRGLSQLGKDQLSAQASVLLAGEPDVSSLLASPAPKKNDFKQIVDKSIGEYAQKYAVKADSQKTPSQCPVGSTPILKNSKIVGCSGNAQTSAKTKLVAPRVVIINGKK